MQITLAPDQAEQLAHGMLDCVDAIHRRLITDWKNIDSLAAKSLVSLSQSLCAQASLLVNQAVGMILDNTKDLFAQVLSATRAGEAAIQNIQNVQKVILIATSLIKLGTAIASRDPGVSITAASELFDIIA